MAAEVLLIGAAAVFGAAVGSFLNVCIYRMPREGLSVARPSRSFCPACGFQIPWFDNLPVLSWVLLAGRCRSCQSSISVRYLLVETLTATLFALIVNRLIVEQGTSWGACAVLLVAASGLVVAAMVDADIRQIPDEITVVGMHLVPFAALLFPDIHARAVDGLHVRGLAAVGGVMERLGRGVPAALRDPPASILLAALLGALCFAAGCGLYYLYRRRFLPDEPSRFRDVSLAGTLSGICGAVALYQVLRPDRILTPGVYSFWVSMIGMAFGSGLVFLVGWIGTKVFRKPAMGFGDVKLMGLLGGLAGVWGTLTAFFLACVLGSIVGLAKMWLTRDRYLPFGPFLCLGAVVPILWPEALRSLLEWYASFL